MHQLNEEWFWQSESEFLALGVNIPEHTIYVSFHLFMNKGVSHSESLPVCSWWAALESGWFYAMHEHNLSAVFSSL